MTLRPVPGGSLLALLLMLALGLGAGVSGVSADPILLGLYPPGALSDPTVVDTITDVDAWLAPTGKRVTIAGTAATLEVDPTYFSAELEGGWSRGYVPFVNFRSEHTTTDIANGVVDASLTAWANQIALWASSGQRRLFMAPLLEMNGYWNPFYVHAGYTQFKQAYQRIRQIFKQALLNRGVSHSAILWVFAPNGWSLPEDAFEYYYPGPDVVDIVSVNGYNFGGCPGPTSVWDTFDTALKPYLDRLPTMAPGKPIFISETGTVEVSAQGIGDKNQWLQDVFTRVTAIPNFRGILYLNKGETRSTLPACPNGVDYRLHVPGTTLWQGFRNAMAALPNYVYWAGDSPQMQQFFGDVPAPVPTTVAAVLPLSRSVQVGGAQATAFAVMINTGSATTTNCRPAPPASPPANLGTFSYQTTSAANALIGTANTPGSIAPGAAQNFVFGFAPTGDIPETSLAMRFQCDNISDAASTPGVNNFFIVASTSPVPDTIALMSTISGDGIVHIPGSGGLLIFAVATTNVGAPGTIDVSADDGGAGLPLALTLCETNTLGACLAPAAPTVTVNYTGGTNRSFAFFAQASGSIPLNPASSRVFVRLRQSGVLRGATSTAVCTTPNAGC